MERRGSISSLFSGFGISSESVIDSSEIDLNFRGSLYPYDPAVLEKRCADSMNADIVIANRSPVTVKRYSAAKDKYKETKASTKSFEEVVEGLKIEYYTPNYDPLIDHLLEISSWKEEYGDDNDILTEKFMSKIEETDTDKDVIIGILTTKIDENYDDLMSCISNVKSVSDDLAQAGELIRRSRQRIRGASEVIQSGAIKIRTLQGRREQLQGLAETLRSVKALQDVHRAMVSSLQTGEVGRAAELASSVLMCLRNNSYDHFSALKVIGDSMQRSIFVIRQKTDKALKRVCCRKFAALEYENIVQSYLALDEMNETIGIQLCDPDGEDDEEDDVLQTDSAGCMEGLANRIYRFQLRDIDACLHTAVVEYIYAAQQEKQKAAAELDVAGVYTTMSDGEVMDLAEGPLNVLYRRLTPSLLGPCVVRSCELLADAIHTHYLITQWHSTPFDERNGDVLFLHRCPVDLGGAALVRPDEALLGRSSSAVSESGTSMDSIDEDEELTFQRPRTSTNGSSSMLSANLNRTSRSSLVLDYYFTALDEAANSHHGERSKSRQLALKHRHKLVEAYQTLAACRSLLWEELQRSLVEMLNLMSFNATVKSDDYLSMVWALNGMVALGREFCGSESSALRKCLDDKSKEYFTNFHVESFQTLRQMLQEDCWQSMPLSQAALRQLGGVLGIVKGHCPRDAIGTRLLRQHCSGAGHAAGPEQGSGGSSLQHKLRRSSIRYISQETATTAPSALRAPSGGDDAASPPPTSSSILMLFGQHGNPFHFMTSEDHNSDLSSHQSNGHHKDKDVNKNGRTKDSSDGSFDDTDGFWQIINEPDPSSSSSNNNAMHMIVTQTALNGLSKYTANYLHMMYILPNNSLEIFSSLMQLFDFYLCSVFVGFVPLEERNKFLTRPTKMTAPAPDQCRDYEVLLLYLERALEATIVSSASSTKPQRVASTRRGSILSSSLSPSSPSGDADSDESSPGLGGASKMQSTEVKLASLLTVPEVVTAGDFANMYSLNERIVAAESCWFVAKILMDIKPKILKLSGQQNREHCDEVITQFQTVAGQLRSLVYRAACPFLIRQSAILPQIVENSGWDTKKLKETNHEWVDKLVASSREIWDYLLQVDQFAESSTMVREQVWMEVCQCQFDLVMEGYSRVRKVSPEGRSAMTMDVFALHDGLNSIHLCRPPRGKHHVDNFLRAAYMSEEDMMQWLHENWRQYSYKHMLGLLVQTLSAGGTAAALLAAGGVGGGRRLKEAISVLDGLYEIIESPHGQGLAPSSISSSSGGSIPRRNSILSAVASSASRFRDADNGSSHSSFSSPVSQLMPQFAKR